MKRENCAAHQTSHQINHETKSPDKGDEGVDAGAVVGILRAELFDHQAFFHARFEPEAEGGDEGSGKVGELAIGDGGAEKCQQES